MMNTKFTSSNWRTLFLFSFFGGGGGGGGKRLTKANAVPLRTDKALQDHLRGRG